MKNSQFSLKKKYSVSNKKEKNMFLKTIKKLSLSEKKLIKGILSKEKNEELLFSIIIIEKMNRGQIYYFEKTISLILPKLILHFDNSIGICQIRPSTAKLVMDSSDLNLIKLLIDRSSNIEIMCKLIKYYKKNCSSEQELLNYYLTGRKNPKSNPEIVTYQHLVKWSCMNTFYKKYIDAY